MTHDSEAARKLTADYRIERCRFLVDEMGVKDEVNHINRYFAANHITHFFACVNLWSLEKYTGLDPAVVKGCINDDGKLTDDWRLVVNWNFPAPGLYAMENFPKTRFLLGPEFVILPDNFDREIISKRTFNRPIKNLLIAMGGADEYNLTTGVVRKVLDENLDLHLIIILGAGFEGHDELNSVLQSASLSYDCKTSVADMFTEYMNCDAAIGTGGLTSSELVATHTPSLLVAAYEHQEARCRYFGERGVAVYLGDLDACKNKSLKEGLAKLENFDADNFSMRFRGAEEIYNYLTNTSN